jgi:hypothetical protein
MNTQGSARLIELTRDQLFEKIWAVPASRLCTEFGISDVALSKTCKRLGIPRPPRRYWARLAAGQKIRKPSLPPQDGDNAKTVTFDVESNQKRRLEFSNDAAQRRQNAERHPLTREIELVQKESELDPRARKIPALMKAIKPDQDGRVLVQGPELPQINASLEQASRIASAFDAIIRCADSIGITSKGGEQPSSLRFCRDDEYLTLRTL